MAFGVHGDWKKEKEELPKECLRNHARSQALRPIIHSSNITVPSWQPRYSTLLFLCYYQTLSLLFLPYPASPLMYCTVVGKGMIFYFRPLPFSSSFVNIIWCCWGDRRDDCKGVCFSANILGSESVNKLSRKKTYTISEFMDYWQWGFRCTFTLE